MVADVSAVGKHNRISGPEELQMKWLTRSGVRRTVFATGIAGAAVMAAIVPANATPTAADPAGVPAPLGPFSLRNDPGCDVFGWQHPMCAGGAFDTPADDGIPGDNAAFGGIPAPASVPNVDGSLSPPGMPGDV